MSENPEDQELQDVGSDVEHGAEDLMDRHEEEPHQDSQEHAPRVARSASNQPLISEAQAREHAGGSPIKARPVKRAPRARRMSLSLTRLDAWSVAKVSFMLSVAGGLIQIVAVGVLWGVLSVVGVFDQLTQIFSSTGLDAGSINLTDIFSLSTVLSAVTIFSVVEVVLFTLLFTIIALLYNVVSSLVGGVHMTLGDD